MIGNLPKSVSRRAVFFIGGYDPKSAKSFFDKHDRETGRFETLWNAEVDRNQLESLSTDVTRASYTAKGDGWSCETDMHFLTLDDVVLKDFDRPFPVRLGRYLLTFFDYTLTGTGMKFLIHAWRFFLYFMYPFVMLLAAFVISLAIAMMIWTSGVALAWLSAPVIFLAAFSAFVQLGGKRYHVLHLMDLWSFSRDYLRGLRPDMERKLDGLAKIIAGVSSSGDYDEIVLVGHSTGGALILDAASRAAEKVQNPAFTVLTVGSTALKIGMHPAAGRFRDRISALFTGPAVQWAEYQCLTDVINFYRTAPARLMQIENAHPAIRSIRVKQTVDKAAYRRMRGNFFRVHYQFVFGNTKSYHYDFPAICFGPHSLGDRLTLSKPLIGSVAA